MILRSLMSLMAIIVLMIINFVQPARAVNPGQLNETAALKIDFVVSEPCSLVAFVNTLADGPQTTIWFKQWYEKKCQSILSQANTMSGGRALLDRYKRLLEGDYKFVSVTGMQLELDEEILCLAGQCSTLPELLHKLKPLVKDQDFSTLQNVFEYFAPSYHALVWQPCLKTIMRQRDQFAAQAGKAAMAERLQQVQKFLQSPWQRGLPFTVVLTPLPVKGNGTHGQPMGAIQVVELLPDDTFKSEADVIFHEAVHALWFAKPDYEHVDKQFQVSGLGRLPQTELYEGMATAIGEGWFSKCAFGSPLRSQWYADEPIDIYSHAVFPLYQSYLNSGRMLDSQFAKQATQIYFDKVAPMAKKISFTESYFVMADEIADHHQFKSEIRQALPRLRDFILACPIADDKNIKALNESQAMHAAILAAKDKLDELAKLGLTAGQLNVLRQSSLPTTTLKVNNRDLLFCLADSDKQQESLLFNVLQGKQWPLPVSP